MNRISQRATTWTRTAEPLMCPVCGYAESLHLVLSACPVTLGRWWGEGVYTARPVGRASSGGESA